MFTCRITRAAVQAHPEYYLGNTQSNPQPRPEPQPARPLSAASITDCADLARAMYKEFRLTRPQRDQFWACIPESATLDQDYQAIQTFAALMREHNDFDKALAVFQEINHV